MRENNNYPNNSAKTSMLQRPILGPVTTEKILEDIVKAITGEATAADFYSRLLRETDNELYQEFIKDAYEDELKHLHFFERLYYTFTGTLPKYTITPVEYDSFKDGILYALKDEQEAAGFYRDVQLSVNNNLIKDVFYLAMVDELEHATKFSTIYNDL